MVLYLRHSWDRMTVIPLFFKEKVGEWLVGDAFIVCIQSVIWFCEGNPIPDYLISIPLFQCLSRSIIIFILLWMLKKEFHKQVRMKKVITWRRCRFDQLNNNSGRNFIKIRFLRRMVPFLRKMYCAFFFVKSLENFFKAGPNLVPTLLPLTYILAYIYTLMTLCKTCICWTFLTVFTLYESEGQRLDDATLVFLIYCRYSSTTTLLMGDNFHLFSMKDYAVGLT